LLTPSSAAVSARVKQHRSEARTDRDPYLEGHVIDGRRRVHSRTNSDATWERLGEGEQLASDEGHGTEGSRSANPQHFVCTRVITQEFYKGLYGCPTAH
jgi:hypothetical protein